jgi:structural maintenance of chromosome 4
LEKELTEERERNKDDITHLDMLEKHYKEREKAYQVCIYVFSLCANIDAFPQEVKAAAEEAAKDKAAREKQSVGLEERRKHASAKAKKLKKALADVSLSLSFCCWLALASALFLYPYFIFFLPVFIDVLA